MVDNKLITNDNIEDFFNVEISKNGQFIAISL
jgi:hypothetical protein